MQQRKYDGHTYIKHPTCKALHMLHESTRKDTQKWPDFAVIGTESGEEVDARIPKRSE